MHRRFVACSHRKSLVFCIARKRAGVAQAVEWYREDLVGQAVIESGIPREELFLTSKLHPRHHGYDSAMIQVSVHLLRLARHDCRFQFNPRSGSMYEQEALQLQCWPHL